MGSKGEYKQIEETHVFVSFCAVASQCWCAVVRWPPLARDTLGKQLVRAIDGVGANLVEGDGRFSDADTIRFFVTARASAREARYWLVLALERGLLGQDEAPAMIETVDQASKELNGLISYRRNRSVAGHVREDAVGYPSDADGVMSDRNGRCH
jgi:four helix bundle protein